MKLASVPPAAEQAVRDDAFLDLRGALEDLGETRVAPVTLDGMQGRVAGAAVDLDALAGDALGHLGGEELHHRGLLVAALAGVDLLADEIHELACRLDLRRHVGDLEADGLEVRDRVAELLAVVGVLDRIVERALGEADGAGGGVGAGRLEAGRRVVEGVAFLADQVGLVDAEIVEGQFPGLPAEIADLGDRRAADALGQLAALLLDEEHGRGRDGACPEAPPTCAR